MESAPSGSSLATLGGEALVLEHVAEHARLAAAGADDQVGDDARPAGLVRRAEAGAVVAVEVLVEEEVVLPGRVRLHALDRAEAGPAPVGAGEEDRHEPPAEVGLDLAER